MRRQRQVITVTTIISLAICFAAGEWVRRGALERLARRENATSYTVSQLTSAMVESRLHYLSRLALSLASNDAFLDVGDRAFDDLRLQAINSRLAYSLAMQAAIEDWIVNPGQVAPIAAIVGNRSFVWNIFRGLPSQTASGRPIAEQRRKLAENTLAANPSIQSITELDAQGRIVFMAPFADQTRSREFDLSQLLARATQIGAAGEPRLVTHAPLQSGKDEEFLSFIQPIRKPGADGWVLVTASQRIQLPTNGVSFSAYLPRSERLMYGGTVADPSRDSDALTQISSSVVIGNTLLTVVTRRDTGFVGTVPIARVITFAALIISAFIAANSLARHLLKWIEKEQSVSDRALKEVSEGAQSLAHDFRNEVMALKGLMGSLGAGQVTFEQLQRFQGLINDLSGYTELLSVRLTHEAFARAGFGRMPVRSYATYLRGVVETVAHEQQKSLGAKILLMFKAPGDTPEPFVSIGAAELTRVIVNILRNSIEACRAAGTSEVAIEISSDPTWAFVQVRDNGNGISELDRDRVFEWGYSTKGTERGTGLTAAREFARSAGGALTIRATEPGKGTTLELVLPRVDTPPWFFSRIQLTSKTVLVIVDDEGSIYYYWEQAVAARFHGMDIPTERMPQLISLNTPSQLRANFRNALLTGTLFLIDQEFKTEGSTGLDVIEELGLSSNAILVTNYWEKPEVVERVNRLGIRMLPKIHMLNTKFPLDIGVDDE
jgi:signal transduction histidine kinase